MNVDQKVKRKRNKNEIQEQYKTEMEKTLVADNQAFMNIIRASQVKQGTNEY